MGFVGDQSQRNKRGRSYHLIPGIWPNLLRDSGLGWADSAPAASPVHQYRQEPVHRSLKPWIVREFRAKAMFAKSPGQI